MRPGAGEALASPASAPQDYFAALRAAFANAAGRAGSIDYTISAGPRQVRLVFAGSELVRTGVPPLAAATPTAPARPAATICLFDSASTGVAVPPFAWRPRHVRQRGEIEGFNDHRFRTIYHGDVLAPDGGFDA